MHEQADISVIRNTPVGTQTWALDDKTGYKYLAHTSHGLTLDKKIKFIDLLRKCWPNIAQARREIGISSRVYKQHIAMDAKFAADIEDIKEELVDRIEGIMAENAQSGPKGFLDRIAFLRAHRRDLYGNRATVDVNVHNVSRDELSYKLDKMSNVFDTQLVTELDKPT